MIDISLELAENDVDTDLDIDEAQTVVENDHSKLVNRDAEDAHPMSAITGLEGAISGINTSLAGFNTSLAGFNTTLGGLNTAVSGLGNTLTSQGERIDSLEKSKIRLMTAEEVEEILNA